MPAPSKAAQAAAGIAHAVDKGNMPKSKLKGASKNMYQSMTSKEMSKQATTGSTAKLPKHVKESTEAVANLFGRSLVGEAGHKAGCQCGFCKNKGNIGKKKDADKDKEEPSEPEVTEAELQRDPRFRARVWSMPNAAASRGIEREIEQGMADDEDADVAHFKQQAQIGRAEQAAQAARAAKQAKGAPATNPMHAAHTSPQAVRQLQLQRAQKRILGPGGRISLGAVGEDKTDVKLSKGVNLGGSAARSYHNMTSKQAMTPGWKPKAYIKAAGEISGNAKHGQMKSFKNRSAAETTTGKHIESRVPGAAAKQIVEALLG